MRPTYIYMVEFTCGMKLMWMLKICCAAVQMQCSYSKCKRIIH